MKPISPNPEPLDELLAAAIHGELTPAERTALDARLATDPAARAAYQEIQHMHDLLEKNYRDAQPDPAFEDRMISAVRRKVRAEQEHRETAWESVLVLWRGVKGLFGSRRAWAYGGAFAALLLVVSVGVAIHEGQHVRGVFATIHSQIDLAQGASRSLAMLPMEDSQAKVERGNDLKDGSVDANKIRALSHQWASQPTSIDQLITPSDEPTALTKSGEDSTEEAIRVSPEPLLFQAKKEPANTSALAEQSQTQSGNGVTTSPAPAAPMAAPVAATGMAAAKSSFNIDGIKRTVSSWSSSPVPDQARSSLDQRDMSAASATSTPPAKVNAAPAATAEHSRKLVRDAQLDLEVKNYQKTVDAITAMAKADGGYLDNSNSQRGGNGKLQGTVVVKLLPENLDGFLLKLRDLGDIKNQSVSTEDVTKDYYDTQARLDNSRRMETQLQDLLKHDNGKVSDLLQVERELGRVRGEIEQMQGQLKLYDFQVQFATVTMSVAEKDLNQAAAYLLRENDSFSLFTHDVEAAFAQAKGAADTFKAEILSANLQHDTGSNSMAASLDVSVPPDQIDGFLTRVRALGRVDNFTRTTNRVANDGGDTSQPADQTRTEKDRVQVELTIRADDESPRQVTQLAVASTGDIDTQAQQLKDDAAKSGAAVTASNFERAPDGTETATLTFRLALSKTGDLLSTLEKLGRVESLTVQRNDRPDQAAADPTAPAEIRLSLHNMPVVRFEDETPCQQTQLAIASTGDVDAQAQQVKSDALKAGMAVTASSFERQPDGTESAALTFRVPLAKAADFTATLEKLGHVESLAVQRNDVTGNSSTDPNAPAEISLSLHNEPAFVADDRGFWATLKRTFGHGIAAFLGSVEMVGVLIAFVLPWLVALIVFAWIGRRIYVARRARS
jgi:hypothetical protein